MLFNSLSFAIFLPIVFGLYWALPHKFRWIVLLLSSCYFYMSWNVKYIVLILFTTIISYMSAIVLERFPRYKRWMLGGTLVSSLGILFTFKYFNFASESICRICEALSIPVHPVTLKLMLPVGISFYTFQTLSYVLDVYHGTMKAEHHFGKYAAFVTFFPQLVAGPIERAENLLPQISGKHVFNYGQAVYGMKLITWGMFKKVVIADNFAVYVDLIYNNIRLYRGFSLVAATVMFAFQIYCDFSGYSDIAMGTAKLFGIDLMSNFRSPYFSATIKEFWGRWHISLSTWFRDYIYIPLGGNRKGTARQYSNLMVTFLASGLWHGANWTFFMWGGIYGFLQITENILRIKTDKYRKHGLRWWLSVIGVFILVCFCWIFFRAADLRDALYIIGHMLDGAGNVKNYILQGYTDMQMHKTAVVHLFFPLLLLLFFDYASLKRDVLQMTGRMPGICRWGLYYAVVMLIIVLGNFGSSQFVYFQF